MSECPVDTFKDAYPLLRRPFTPAAVRFKVQATWSSGALIVAYIDARLAAGRLNHVIPHKWSSTFDPVDKGLLCRLTVDGITREDIGADYVGKGLYSDALKRAAVHFGVGESLYVLPKMTLNEGQLLKGKEYKGKRTFVLTPMGEAHCRSVYTTWLETDGIAAFGEPLDHGDVTYDEAEPVEAIELTPLDDFKAIAAGYEFDEDPEKNVEIKRAVWDWVRLDDENLRTATDLLEDGKVAALVTAVDFESSLSAAVEVLDAEVVE